MWTEHVPSKPGTPYEATDRTPASERPRSPACTPALPRRSTAARGVPPATWSSKQAAIIITSESSAFGHRPPTWSRQPPAGPAQRAACLRAPRHGTVRNASATPRPIQPASDCRHQARAARGHSRRARGTDASESWMLGTRHDSARSREAHVSTRSTARRNPRGERDRSSQRATASVQARGRGARVSTGSRCQYPDRAGVRLAPPESDPGGTRAVSRALVPRPALSVPLSRRRSATRHPSQYPVAHRPSVPQGQPLPSAGTA